MHQMTVRRTVHRSAESSLPDGISLNGSSGWTGVSLSQIQKDKRHIKNIRKLYKVTRVHLETFRYVPTPRIQRE